ncbi:sugar kinase [Tunicatimonas pelagia]|uniref:sugar kinase n=1 Tax=Tunicatimonas pelagia TaxID=931531 RepID=UPI0026653CC1|nr:sugar kinase [Tunicatimonas pelagia]WKN43062.1 sugar kinase [Tunicatimonas pelagia]
MSRVVCFGEVLLRLSPLNGHERIAQTNELKVEYSGAEANVAASLSLMGHQVKFITKLPSHVLGNAAIRAVREYGVNMNGVARGGKRIGTYFIEHGSTIRPTRIIYDREHSAIADSEPKDFDWPELLQEQAWFVSTGITPALSPNCAKACSEALITAKELGVTTAFDLNFRRSLWSLEEGRAVLQPMLEHVDVLFSNIGSSADVLDIHPTKRGESWEDLVASTWETAEKLMEHRKFKWIALTVRAHHSATENDWAGILYDGTHRYESRKYRFQIVDRLGGGDAFMAGIIHGISQNWDGQKTVEFAAAASALKHTIPGDVNISSEEEILEVAEGNTSGRVKR